MPRSASTLFSLAIWLGLLIYAWFIRDQFVHFVDAGISAILCLALLCALQVVLQTTFLPLFLKPLGLNLGFRDWLSIGLVTMAGNIVTPIQAATAMRAVYLKKVFGTSYTKSAAVSIFQFLTRVLTYCLAAIPLLLFFTPVITSRVEFDTRLILLALGITALSIILAVWSMRLQPVRQFTQAMTTLLRNGAVLATGVLVTLALLILNAAAFALALELLSVNTRLPDLIAYTLIKFFLLLAPITPGNIGVAEVATGTFASSINAEFEAGVAAAVFIRLLTALLVFMFSAPALAHLKRLTSEAPTASGTSGK